jgi:hypothetical protein
MVIGRYLQYAAAIRGNSALALEAEYEQFAEHARGLTRSLITSGKERQQKRIEKEGPKEYEKTFSAFSYEDLAQHLSSILLSLFVFFWGLSLWLAQPTATSIHPSQGLMTRLNDDGVFFMVAGLCGFGFSALSYWRYRRRLDALGHLVEALKEIGLVGPGGPEDFC